MRNHWEFAVIIGLMVGAGIIFATLVIHGDRAALLKPAQISDLSSASACAKQLLLDRATTADSDGGEIVIQGELEAALEACGTDVRAEDQRAALSLGAAQ